MNKRLLKFFQPLAARIPLEWLIRITGQRLFLPFYHTLQQDKPLPHIQHLYQLRTVKDFEKDLDYLLKNYDPISLEDLVIHIKNKQTFNKNTFFLSFDDGLREVYDLAAPILQKKGIPTTVFLNAAFVDNKGLFFRYKASLLIEHLKTIKLLPASQKKLEQILQSKNTSKAILKVSYTNKETLDKVAELLGYDFQDFLKKEQPYLTSEQIKTLKNRGFSFGSHSIDHPLYNELDLSEQIRQTKTSQHFVNEHFKPNIKAFAFPFTDYGVSNSFFETIKKEEVLDISFGTAGLKNDMENFHLQRFPVEALPFQMNELINTEYFYYFCKSFLGKNTILRK